MRMVLCVVLELDGILSKEITGCARRAPFKCRTVNRIYNKQSLSGRVRPAQCGNADSSSWGATYNHPPTTSHPRTRAHISRNSTVRDYDYSAIFYMARHTHNVCVCVVSIVRLWDSDNGQTFSIFRSDGTGDNGRTRQPATNVMAYE